VRGSAISFLSPSPQTKLTDGYAAVGNIEPDTSRTLQLKTAGVPSPEHSAGASQERGPQNSSLSHKIARLREV